jgi:Tol biopolymer transport system component
MALTPDSLLYNRYRIRAELGRGGMGAVYHAHDENLGVDVAIKENLFVSPEHAQQFRREATLLASLRHPGLPRVTDHFVIPDQGQYLVMDFVAGQDARQRLVAYNRPLPESEVLRWARDILDALSYLHSRPKPVVHRDIKPGNVKVTPEGRAVLVDFGLAKLFDEAQATLAGAKALTPGFSPPEQYGGGHTDPRSDLYALGATLYALLSGQAPPDSLDRALGKAPLIPLRTLNPEISHTTATAIQRALALKPDERFRNASEFLAAIGRDDRTAQAAPVPTQPRPAELATLVTGPAPALASPGWAARPSSPIPPPVPPTVLPARRARRLPWLMFGAAGLFLLLLAGGGAVALYATGLFRPTPSASATFAPVTETAPVVIIDLTLTPTAPAISPSAAPTATPESSETAPIEATATETATEVPPPSDTPPPAPTPAGGGPGQIAFVSERTGRPQIFLVDGDGNNLVQVTDVADGACQPAWSPDGQQILFTTPCVGKREQYTGAAIYIVNADGNGLRPFITLLGGTYAADWSAGGVAFVFMDQQRPQIYVADNQGAGPVRISAERSDDSQPSWAPDGQRLAFRNFSRSGRSTVYWMFRDGTFADGGANPDTVTRDVDAGYPAWSPDGQYITFMVGSDIWITGWDQLGFGALQLTTTGPNADPAWSPDSQWIVFESWRDAAQHDLYRMTFTGSQVTRITNDPALDYQPAWRP